MARKSAAAQAVGEEDAGARVRRAAIALFAQRGFHGAGIRDIAAAAKLTSATLYHYMKNKDDLLVEIMSDTITPLLGAAQRIKGETSSPVEALASLVEHHVWAHASDRLSAIVTDTELRALSGARLRRVVKLRDDYEHCWRDIVQSGVREGQFETGHADLAARAILEMATGVSHWYSPSGKMRLEDLCAEYADWALALLRAKRGGRTVRRADLDLSPPHHYLKP